MSPAIRSATASMHGAVTIINATATGNGCALAVQGGVTAEWTWTDGERLEWRTHGVDDRLARAVHGIFEERQGAPGGAMVTTRTTTPPSRGLKTSSSAAAALVAAAAKALGTRIDRDQVTDMAVEASLAAGVTITGAYDDQVAVVRGGCHFTHNADRRILATLPVPDLHVAMWIPDQAIHKSEVAALDTAPIRSEVEAAEALLRAGDLAGAMTRSGAAYTRLYQSAGLPVTQEPADIALTHGALGAGLSGTGPAVAALFSAPTPLPTIAGGTWVWTRTVPTAAEVMA